MAAKRFFVEPLGSDCLRRQNKSIQHTTHKTSRADASHSPKLESELRSTRQYGQNVGAAGDREASSIRPPPIGGTCRVKRAALRELGPPPFIILPPEPPPIPPLDPLNGPSRAKSDCKKWGFGIFSGREWTSCRLPFSVDF